ncbi:MULTISPECIES: hypothetical protein [unclassified Halomonas]|uniref:hypothetical protein n=1 Tax=unclassified Halomonas TaxID=2609666 RepID=UPI002076937E|nr:MULTISPECIES: hypothetical protein [unclassified Halomonas]
MNRRLSASFACLLITAAQADVHIVDANLLPDASSFEVLIENSGDRSVARGYIATRFITPGRSVPWVDSWEQSYAVPGGVEPGETHMLKMDAPVEVESIDGYEIVPDILFFSAFDVSGAPLNDDAEAVMRSLEADRRETEELLKQLNELESD